MRARIALATACTVAWLAGCATGRGASGHARPSLWEQSQTTAIRILPSAAAPRFPWDAETEPSGAVRPGAGWPDWQRALGAGVVAAGSRRGQVRFELAEVERAPEAPDFALPGAPPAGNEAYAVGLASVEWLGGDAVERPVFLTATVRARKLPWAAVPERPGVLVTARLVDPTPYTRREWLAEEGARLRAGLDRLLAAGAERLVADLTEIVGTGPPRTGGWCGLQPTEELLTRQFDGEPAPLRWLPFVVPADAPSPPSVTYEVRVWRLDGSGASLVTELTGLPEPSAVVTLAPGHEHAFSARARLQLAGSRSWTAPWSVWVRPGGECGLPLEPYAALRRFVAGTAAEDPDPAPPAEEVLPSLAIAGGPVRLVVAAGRPQSQVQLPQAGRIPSEAEGARAGAAAGAAQGAAAGAALSLLCGPFAPLCAIYTVPRALLEGSFSGEHTGRAQARREAAAAEALASMQRWDTLQLRWALETVARDPEIRRALVETLRAAQALPVADGAASPSGATLELSWTGVSLVGDAQGRSSATLELELVATLSREGSDPIEQAVKAVGPGPLPADAWLQDDRALLKGAVRAQLLRAARGLMGTYDPR